MTWMPSDAVAKCPVWVIRRRFDRTTATSGLPLETHIVRIDSSVLKCANSGSRGRGLLDQIAGAARRDAASLWKSCFAEAVDIQLKPRSIAARYPFRNAKIGIEFEQTGHRLPRLCFAS